MQHLANIENFSNKFNKSTRVKGFNADVRSPVNFNLYITSYI